MREPVRDRDRLEHILESIDRILAFADGKSLDDIPHLHYKGISHNL